MTLEKVAQKYISEIGENLTFEKAEEIAGKINNLVYSKNKTSISQTDKELIYEYILIAIEKGSIIVEEDLRESQNAKNRNAASYLLQTLQPKKRNKK
ncbi:MAG TPA: hypothetical protein GX725_03145 [Mollicutes bacterium]|jgi:hypothetical protein|nr:hypothetical protein [Mollicutes bacterium]